MKMTKTTEETNWEELFSLPDDLPQDVENKRITDTLNTFGQAFNCKIKLAPQGIDSSGQVNKNSIDEQITSKILGDRFQGYQFSLLDTEEEKYTKVEQMLCRIIFPHQTFRVRRKCHDLIWENNKMQELKNNENYQALLSSFQKLSNTAVDIIEQHRVESLYGEIYQGSKSYMDSLRREFGKDYEDGQIANPVDALAFTNSNRNDLSNISGFGGMKKYLDMVEKRDFSSCIESVKLFMHEKLIPYMQEELDRIKIPQDPPPPQTPSGDPQTGKGKDDPQTGNGNDPQTGNVTTQKTDPTDPQKKTQKRKVKELIKSNETTNEDFEEISENNWGDVEDDIVDTPFNPTTSEENATKDIDVAKNKLHSIVNSYTEHIEGTVFRERENKGYIINELLRKQLYGIFREIKEKQIRMNEDEGSDIDIEDFIQYKVDSNNSNFFIQENKIKDMDIIISVDCSGSMKSELSHARSICATLMSVVKSMPDIKMEIHAWSGQHTCALTIIKSVEDCGKLDSLIDFNMTPTYYAVNYAVEILKKSKSTSKILFVVTDGEPNDVGDLDKVSKLIAKNTDIKVIGMYLSGLRENPNMRKMFGKRYFICGDMLSTSIALVNNFKIEIVKFLRK